MGIILQVFALFCDYVMNSNTNINYCVQTVALTGMCQEKILLNIVTRRYFFLNGHELLGLQYFDLLNMKSIGLERSIKERTRDYFSYD